MTPKLNLGLCNLPEPIYLYVRNGGSEGKNYCWYYHDPETKINTPEYATGICGYLSELRLTSKEFKGKETMKLDIVVSANETYIIRTGVETNFAKSFLLAIALVEDLSRPLIIGCNAGEQNTVFCQVYDAITKSRIKAPWNVQADCASIIHDVQTKLGGVQEDIQDVQLQTKRRLSPPNIFGESNPAKQLPSNSTRENTLPVEENYDRTLLNAEIESLLKRKNISVELAQDALFELFKVRSRQYLRDKQLAEFLEYLKSPKYAAAHS
ncbi:MAG: hypothetical protein V7K76_14485 [Nostoc sp.]|uniref:hypothetical protein n=1 Tax=Nostoc sp. TaxID=1180 RepID=UPI002FF95856